MNGKPQPPDKIDMPLHFRILAGFFLTVAILLILGLLTAITAIIYHFVGWYILLAIPIVLLFYISGSLLWYLGKNKKGMSPMQMIRSDIYHWKEHIKDFFDA